jgi:hypothetical protein
MNQTLSVDLETSSLKQVSSPTISINVELKFHQDSGHGWLAVKRSTLSAWGILDKISPCSYQSKSGKTVYLEEDGDMKKFVDQAKSRGIEVMTKESYQERSPIRSYDRFKV